MAWTTTELLAKIRLLSYLPSASTKAFTDAELLSIADKAISDRFVPWLVEKKVELFVRRLDTAIELGRDLYRIPPRAYGARLREVTFIDASGNGYPVDEWDLARRDKMLGGNPSLGSGGYAFCLEGDSVLLLPPSPQRAGTLRMRYYRRPSKLCLVSAAAQVGTIDSASVLSVTAAPASFTSESGVLMDITEQYPNFDVPVMDNVGDLDTLAITFTDPIPSTGYQIAERSNVAVGDWISLAGTTPVPHIPADLHDALADAVGVQIARSLGNMKAVAVAEAFVTDALNRLVPAFSPRSDGGAKVVVNRKSQLRRGRF